jgi:ribosomal protein L24E
MCYSLGAYCADQIANGTGTMQVFAKATVVYGNHAKTYFASIAN